MPLKDFKCVIHYASEDGSNIECKQIISCLLPDKRGHLKRKKLYDWYHHLRVKLVLSSLLSDTGGDLVSQGAL